ncbi:hypothetical protein GCM10009837_07860 [Streptomyces durmitorensis]|uniref:Tail assembly chaperone n=1 Tax=Streptomyces durmitorensis TaxID=319947 RepID=A0ABY4PL44_9ACTN|nr:hypothetical protein [Streptomyces durmitorensis]UQT54326.1 hypothetical protein M4V62_04085 [Streptomyces durmitorensis]
MAANARTATARTKPAARKKTAAARPPRKTDVVVPDVEPDEDYDDEDDDAAEAQESEALGGYVTARLRGEELRVLPPMVWRQSWNRLLNSGQIDAFAELAIHPDDFEVYEELDPTNGEFGEFIGEASEQAPESQGKSRGPNRSTRRMRRR